MLRRSLLQRLIRRRLIAVPVGSVSETYPRQIEVIVQPIQTEVAEQFVRRIDELISRHRQTPIPTALQAEFEIYPRLYEEVAALNNEIVDYLQAYQVLPSERLLERLIRLQLLGQKYIKKIQKVASYLGQPMPTLTEMKQIPGMIMFAARWRLHDIKARRIRL